MSYNPQAIFKDLAQRYDEDELIDRCRYEAHIDHVRPSTVLRQWIENFYGVNRRISSVVANYYSKKYGL